MFRYTKIAVAFILTVFIFSSLSLAEDSFTITTYYPSPYGSYNELETHSNAHLAIDNGNVGIGTAKPTSKLGVVGNLAVGVTYGLSAAPASGAIIEGNVGIGTPSPGANLHVVGDVTIVGKAQIRDGTQSYGYVLTSGANGVASWQPSTSGVPAGTLAGWCEYTYAVGGGGGSCTNVISPATCTSSGGCGCPGGDKITVSYIDWKGIYTCAKK